MWKPHFEHLHFSSGTSHRESPSHCWQVKFSVFTCTERHSWIKTTLPTKMMGWEWGTLKPEVSIHSPAKKWLLFSVSVQKCLQCQNQCWGVQATQLGPSQKICRVTKQTQNYKGLTQKSQTERGIEIPFWPNSYHMPPNPFDVQSVTALPWEGENDSSSSRYLTEV